MKRVVFVLVVAVLLSLVGCSSKEESSHSFPTRKLDMPFRQDDPRWAKQVMWDYDMVMQTATEVEGLSARTAHSLLRRFPDNNNIGHEGCLLTSLSMVLRLFDPQSRWNPSTLNKAAQQSYYYTKSGLSMQTLYADLLSETTEGKVQLLAKEEYLPGVWPRVFAPDSALLRAYRSLPDDLRKQYLVVLKTGTYDDTVASHYLLVDPNNPGDPEEKNFSVLDPAEPLGRKGEWTLRDSSEWISSDPAIGAEWKRQGIRAEQIGGVWVFVRDADRPASRKALVDAWSQEL